MTFLYDKGEFRSHWEAFEFEGNKERLVIHKVLELLGRNEYAVPRATSCLSGLSCHV